jgi:phosphoribosylformimino-5-aminoimidazole carboxamide ribotide isomerase
VLKRYHGDDGDASFEILPAIDIVDGRVVRLVEGDFSRQTSYSEDPVAVAHAFARDGARWIHVVDLDGAKAGEPAQLDVVTAIVRAVGPGVRCEVGGGVRSLEAADRLMASGAARIVVGTAALRDPSFAGRLVKRIGSERVAAAIDVRSGLAVGDAWAVAASGVAPLRAVSRLADEGVVTFGVTAIERDGRLEGPDLDLLQSIVELDRGAVIASGGVTSVDDLRAVRNIGCSGAIVGRAIYEGTLSLSAALVEMA